METQTHDDSNWREFDNYIREVAEIRELVRNIEQRNENLENVLSGRGSPVDVKQFPHQSGYEEIHPRDKMARYSEYGRVTYEEMLQIIDDDKLRESLVPKMPHQSGLEQANIGVASSVSQHQNVGFYDDGTQYHYEVPAHMDETRSMRDTPDVQLKDWFSRPIRIWDGEWLPLQPLIATFNPWFELMTNKRIANRMANFGLFRGNLKIKVLINGNGFLYGRAIVAYRPKSVDEGGFDVITNTDGSLCFLSQLPHIYLDPTTSSGGEMSLPFVHREDYLDIPGLEASHLGDLYVRAFNPLQNVTGDTTVAAHITILAWFEDVVLAGPTNRQFTAFPSQSGKENEVDKANKDGVISGPATAIARTATALSGISMIAPYAMATASVANGVASAARMFGYSAPPLTKAREPMVNRPMAQMATTTVPALLDKLSVDDKQELSIDPRISGLGKGDDPLAIHNIASREAFIGSFTWSRSQATHELLYTRAVVPNQFVADPDNSLALTPMAIAALPFEYWTGSINFRFQVVCSSFHRGRMVIAFDPYGFPLDFASPSQPIELNTQYVKIVDIAKERDVTFTVPYLQTDTYKPIFGCVHGSIDPAPNNFMKPGDLASINNNFGNGTIMVKVLNELVIQNVAGNEISVNVFVSAGPDFEVAAPTGRLINNYVYFPPQSGMEAAANEFSTTEDNIPQHYEMEKFGGQIQNLSNVNKVYFGETITSFRPLIKRFETHSIVQCAESPFIKFSKHIRHYFPFFRGDYNGAPHAIVGGNQYAFCNTILLHWITTCFLGRRGGMRWKWAFDGNFPERVTATASRAGFLGTSHEDVNTDDPGNLNRNQIARWSVLTEPVLNVHGPVAMLDGSTMTVGQVNPTLEFEIPFYSNKRFVAAKRRDLVSNVPDAPNYVIHARNKDFAGAFWVTSCAAADDFQVYFWTAPLKMWYEGEPPQAA